MFLYNRLNLNKNLFRLTLDHCYFRCSCRMPSKILLISFDTSMDSEDSKSSSPLSIGDCSLVWDDSSLSIGVSEKVCSDSSGADSVYVFASDSKTVSSKLSSFESGDYYDLVSFSASSRNSDSLSKDGAKELSEKWSD